MISEFIEKFKKKCNSSKTEEDIRSALNIFTDQVSSYLNIKGSIENNKFLVSSGFQDCVFNNIIFELKEPNKFKKQNGIKEALYGRNKKDRGLYDYIINKSIDLHPDKSIDLKYFKKNLLAQQGIAFDGKKFIFFRFKDSLVNKSVIITKTKSKKKIIKYIKNFKIDTEIDEVKSFELGVKKLLLLYRSTQRKVLTAENLLNSFCNTDLSYNSISYLYKLLDKNLKNNSKVHTLFSEWKRIFGDIFGLNETDFTKFKDDLISMYKLPSGLNVHKTLFVLQTYYNIVIKLLINNLFQSLYNPASTTKKPETQSDVRELFSGDSQENKIVNNFFEIHFFEWFMLVEDFKVDIIHDIISELDTYETTSSIIKPEIVTDVLKKIYPNLIPRGLRQLLGEYYTPDWLVDFTLEKSKYDINKKTTLLDPACGSGTFLTSVLSKFKEKYKDENSNSLIKLITNNFVGFDINPISVISAKANYILALGDITEFDFITNQITIPIYMCDSILVPSVHAKQKENNDVIKINTVVGNFDIPIFKNRFESDYFLNTLSNCIMKDYSSFNQFKDLLINEDIITISNSNLEVIKILFEKLSSLHHSGKNGFWPIILKNSFAPLFLKNKFDVIVGNPPWITWKRMSDTFKKMTLEIWLSYGIFAPATRNNAYDKITTHDDFAMAVTYVSLDHYLKENSYMCFVLPQTFIKSSKGGEGFRKFSITRNNQNTPFALDEVYDMETIQPFKGYATNRTSVYLFLKNKKMSYPMKNYFVCKNKDKNNKISYEDSYLDVKNKIILEKQSAKPIVKDNLSSAWLTYKPEDEINEKFIGNSAYRGRKGIEPCGAKGVYLIDILKKSEKNFFIKNMIERSRLLSIKSKGVKKGWVEKEFIYPMVGGRDIDKWGINRNIFILVPHDNKAKSPYRGVAEEDLKSKYPKTYEWLFFWKKELLETRIRSGKNFDKKSFPFYRLDNVGKYTFSKYKVLWREQSKSMTSVVISSLSNKYVNRKNIVVDSKVLFASFENLHEAHFLCAVLNSKIANKIITSYTIDIQKGIDILQNIKIPKFDQKNKTHLMLSNLSLDAHKYYIGKKEEKIKAVEEKINKLSLSIF